MQVFKIDGKDLSQNFIDYDTHIEPSGFYELPKGLVLVLLFAESETVFTTIRRWTPQKEKYYRSMMGNEFEIEIKELQEKK